MNKNTLIFTIFLLGIFALPIGAHAQSKPVFKLFSNEKQAFPASLPPAAPMVAPTQEFSETALDLEELKNQPLSIRRKIVANELDSIWTRLSILLDKTEKTTLRLGENGIDISASVLKLDEAKASLGAARVSIDALLLAANDPLNENVEALMIDVLTFKEVVITSESDLRAVRESIIASLGDLKAAVLAKVSPLQ